MDHEEELEPSNGNGAASRRILKVRLRQDHVIRLHELRILQGKSIAHLLEGILEDYFRKTENGSKPHLQHATAPPASSLNGTGVPR